MGKRRRWGSGAICRRDANFAEHDFAYCDHDDICIEYAASPPAPLPYQISYSRDGLGAYNLGRSMLVSAAMHSFARRLPQARGPRALIGMIKPCHRCVFARAGMHALSQSGGVGCGTRTIMLKD